MKNADYKLLYLTYSFDTFEESCPIRGLVDRLKREFDYDYKKFVEEMDFESFELPEHPKDFTSFHWDDLRDYLSDCATERAESKAFNNGDLL